MSRILLCLCLPIPALSIAQVTTASRGEVASENVLTFTCIELDILAHGEYSKSRIWGFDEGENHAAGTSLKLMTIIRSHRATECLENHSQYCTSLSGIFSTERHDNRDDLTYQHYRQGQSAHTEQRQFLLVYKTYRLQNVQT